MAVILFFALLAVGFTSSAMADDRFSHVLDHVLIQSMPVTFFLTKDWSNGTFGALVLALVFINMM